MAAEHLRLLGARIRARREELDMTQEEVARAMPGKVTGARISLWERGENRPRDDSLEHLAAVLQTTAAALQMPEPDKRKTPDLFPPVSVDDRLDRMERRLSDLIEQQNRLLARQSEILEGIEAAIVRDDEAAKRRADDEDEWVDRVVTLAREALAGDVQSPVSTRRTRAKSGTPRG